MRSVEEGKDSVGGFAALPLRNTSVTDLSLQGDHVLPPSSVSTWTVLQVLQEPL